MIEVGAGHGTNFPYYPASVERVVAIEPEGRLRRRAERAVSSAPVPITVLDSVAEELPGEDGSFDAGVAALVLCTVPDQRRALAEPFRVIKPGGELRFYEHAVARNALYARLQRLADATFWPTVLGGYPRDSGCGRRASGSGPLLLLLGRGRPVRAGDLRRPRAWASTVRRSRPARGGGFCHATGGLFRC